MTAPQVDDSYLMTEQDRLERWAHMLYDVAKWFRDFPYPLSFKATADDLEAAAKLLSGVPQPTIKHVASVPQQSALVAAFADGYLLACREHIKRTSDAEGVALQLLKEAAETHSGEIDNIERIARLEQDVGAWKAQFLNQHGLREQAEREVAELRLALDRPTGEKLGRCRGCQRPVIDAPGRTVWCSSCTADMAIKDKDDAERRLERAEDALQNVRMLAMRMRRTDPENAAHLLRFCEDVGIVGSVLRDME